MPAVSMLLSSFVTYFMVCMGHLQYTACTYLTNIRQHVVLHHVTCLSGNYLKHRLYCHMKLKKNSERHFFSPIAQKMHPVTVCQSTHMSHEKHFGCSIHCIIYKFMLALVVSYRHETCEWVNISN